MADMTDAEKGIHYFGYNPRNSESACETTANLFDSASAFMKAALDKNRKSVDAARERGYAGDWKPTRGVLRAISVATGLYFTR